MYRTPTVFIHFIDEKSNKIVLKKLAKHIPNKGDSIRLGGEGSEVYYKINTVIHVYDEDTVPYDRVNCGVEKEKV